MKSIKVVRFLTVAITATLLILFIPFGYFSDLPSANYKLLFSFDINQTQYYFSAINKFKIIMAIIQYGAIALGALMIFAFLLSLIKKPGIKSTFAWFGVILSLLSVPVILLKTSLLANGGGLNWIVSGSLIAVAIVDLVLNIADEVAVRIKNGISVTNTTIIQQQGVAGSAQPGMSDSYNASELTDSLAARQRIESLKSGLSIPSYDDALQEIDATGEWNGLDMKDVQNFDIKEEIKRNEQLRNMNRFGTNSDETSSLKN